MQIYAHLQPFCYSASGRKWTSIKNWKFSVDFIFSFFNDLSVVASSLDTLTFWYSLNTRSSLMTKILCFSSSLSLAEMLYPQMSARLPPFFSQISVQSLSVRLSYCLDVDRQTIGNINASRFENQKDSNKSYQ